MIEKAKRTTTTGKKSTKALAKRRSPLRFEPEPATGPTAWITRESGPLQAARNSLRAGSGTLSRGAIAGMLALSLLFGAAGGAGAARIKAVNKKRCISSLRKALHPASFPRANAPGLCDRPTAAVHQHNRRRAPARRCLNGLEVTRQSDAIAMQ